MSVKPTDAIIYGCVNMPETDNATVGGAPDLTKRISFADLTASTLMDVVSSSASDVATKIIYEGRDSAGIVQSETLTLTGQTKVPGTKTLGRLLFAALSGASAGGPLANPGGTTAVGDVALMAHTLTISAHTAQAGSANSTGTTPALFKLQAGDGASVALGMIIRTIGGTGANQIRMVCSTSGTGAGQYGTDVVAVNRDWTVVPDATTTYEVAPGFLFDILPNPVTAVIRAFATVYTNNIGGGSNTFYEKGFILNTNGTTALTSMTLTKQTDPAGLYGASTIELDIAPCTALDDTNTATNRQTAPAAGVGAFSTGAAPQTITPAQQTAAANAAAQAQGFWMRLTIAANVAPQNTSFELQTSGNTV